MIPVLYSANTTDFSTFGLGVLTDTIFCEVTEERNGVFECLLKYPVSGQHYGLITKECIKRWMQSERTSDGEMIWCVHIPVRHQTRRFRSN